MTKLSTKRCVALLPAGRITNSVNSASRYVTWGAIRIVR